MDRIAPDERLQRLLVRAWARAVARRSDNTLHWLVEQLQAAEDAGERVLMLRHVPNKSR